MAEGVTIYACPKCDFEVPMFDDDQKLGAIDQLTCPNDGEELQPQEAEE